MRREHKSPHMQDFDGPLRDYNGTGKWSVTSVQQRYLEYSRRLDVTEPEVPQPREHHERNVRWIYPIMEPVIAAIDRDDKAAIALGIDFIEESEHFVFGRILKSNTARALRRASLTPQQVERIRKRIVGMLLAGDVPHEFHEYARLLRTIGLGDWWPIIEQNIARDNPYVMRYYQYFRSNAKSETK